MITMQGTIPYPPTAEARPIQALATNLKQLSSGLTQGSAQLKSTSATAQSSWTGQAANAFAGHVDKRAQTVAAIGKASGATVPVLQTFAAAIDTTSAAYSSAATVEQAARAGLPWTAAALAAAIAAEGAALAALQAAGVACAGGLAAIEAEIAMAEFTGVTRQTFTAVKDAAADIWDSVSKLVSDGDADAAAGALATTTTMPKTETQRRGEELSDVAKELSHIWHGTEDIIHIVEGYGEGLQYATKDLTTTYTRNNRELLRWLPNKGGPSIGFTAAQAAARAETLERWTKVAKIPVVNFAIEGGLQALKDQSNTTLTTQQRWNRASAAGVLQGGGALAGATVGAEAGAAVGAAVGVWFGGVGAVPGAVIGGIVGGVGGGIAGSQVGTWIKNALFNINPGGSYK